MGKNLEPGLGSTLGTSPAKPCRTLVTWPHLPTPQLYHLEHYYLSAPQSNPSLLLQNYPKMVLKTGFIYKIFYDH